MFWLSHPHNHGSHHHEQSSFPKNIMDYTATDGKLWKSLETCKRCLYDHNLSKNAYYIANTDQICKAIAGNSTTKHEYADCVRSIAKLTFTQDVCKVAPACKATLNKSSLPMDSLFILAQTERRVRVISFL